MLGTVVKSKLSKMSKLSRCDNVDIRKWVA